MVCLARLLVSEMALAEMLACCRHIFHYGWMNGEQIFINPKKNLSQKVRSGQISTSVRLAELLRYETRVYIFRKNIPYQDGNKGAYIYQAIGVTDQRWRVVTDLTGEVGR